ncbi:unnamed protein product [Durusdinium trenchii]|uniref:Uncharacterized protein n=1 Tax=Durusdinium trenchii TaxID=1381693 RepID=A0ABP0SFL6_9DINO
MFARPTVSCVHSMRKNRCNHRFVGLVSPTSHGPGLKLGDSRMNSLPVVWGGTFRVGDTPARGARHVYLPSPRRAKRCESPVLSASEATTFSLHEGLEIREVDFSKGAGAGAGAWPAPLAAFLGFSLAALIMVPAVVAGPTVAMPPAFGVLFYQLAMLAGQSWFPCIVSATVGVPFAHGLLLVPSITFQYALPALVASAAGLCAARYLGGVWAQHLCLLLLGLLLLFHGFCMLRVIKIGRWQ